MINWMLGRVVTESEKLKTLMSFLTWLLEKLLVPSTKRDCANACEFIQIMGFYVYSTVLANHTSFIHVLIMAMFSPNSTTLIVLQFGSGKNINIKQSFSGSIFC